MSVENRIKRRKKISISFAFDIFLLAVVSMLFTVNSQTYAANHGITGGTNGPNCNSGGYFTPSSLTVTSGDTVTISVPSNDPYAGGLEVHGFPEGNFTIARGDQHTTQPLTSNVSYYGTWPSTGCHKGNGIITISNPSPPPPSPSPSPTPSPTPSPVSHPSSSTTPASSPDPSSSSTNTTAKHPSPSAPPDNSHASKTTSSEDQSPSTNSASASSTAEPATAVDSNAQPASSKKPIGIASIIVVAGIVGWAIWKFIIRAKTK